MENKPKHKKKGGFHTLSVNEKHHGHQLGKGQKPQSKKIAVPELQKDLKNNYSKADDNKKEINI